MQKTAALSTTLIRYRGLARMSQQQLADSTKALGDAHKVSLATIRDIEADRIISKSQTLRKLARGLALDSFTGEVDEVRAEGIYHDLAVAAGHLPPGRAGDNAVVREAAAIVDFDAELARRYGAENIPFMDATTAKLRQLPPKEAAFVRWMLLRSVPDADKPRQNRYSGPPPVADLAQA